MAYKGKYTGAEVDNLLDKAGEIEEFQEVTAAALSALNDKIDEQGDMNPDNYYTKSETDALIPDVSGYVTMPQVEGKGYVTMYDVEAKGYTTLYAVEAKGYVTMAQVEAKGYTTMSAVEAKGYITSASLDGYALSSDVYSKTDIDTKLCDKQDTLIAGEGIHIADDGKTISAVGGGGSGHREYHMYMTAAEYESWQTYENKLVPITSVRGMENFDGIDIGDVIYINFEDFIIFASGATSETIMWRAEVESHYEGGEMTSYQDIIFSQFFGIGVINNEYFFAVM